MSKEEKKNPYVDENCIWCWACVTICSEVFNLDENWLAFVKEKWKDTSNIDWVDDAILACPVNAIHYKD
jgi:ferredoxin